MPKKAYLASHLSACEHKKKYQQSKNPIESRRWHLLWKIAQGWTIKNSAVAVGISYGYAQRIIRNYNQDGLRGIGVKPRKGEKHSGGKVALLSPEQFTKLTQALESKPSDGGLWTGVKVARWIEQETGKEQVWNQRGWDYLNQYEWLYVYGFVEPKSGRTMWYLIPRVNTQWMNVVLETFAIEAGAEQDTIILLVQDRAGWRHEVSPLGHRSQKINLPKGVETEFLPAYSPELYAKRYPLGQPAERLWSLVDEAIANQNIESIDELEEILSQRCCVLSQMKEEIKNLTNYHWLKYG